MSIAGTIDVPIEIVGGLVCDTAPMDLPAGVSPDCQDLDFSEDGARTRPGLGAPINANNLLAGNVVQYLKTFITGNGTLRALAFTDLGNLYKETAPSIFTLVADLPDATVPAPYLNSTTIFQREYLALSDGKYGVGIPRQFDDTFLDRVSQVGPGAAPGVADEQVSFAVNIGSANALAAAANLTSITQVGNVCTATVSGIMPGQVAIGDTVSIAGNANAAFNGVQTLSAITLAGGGNVASFQFILAQTGLGTGAGGAVTTSLYGLGTAVATNYIVTGMLVAAAGFTPAGYNSPAGQPYSVRGTTGNENVIVNIPGQFALATNSVAGTISVAGNIVAGLHLLSVVFVTRQGYLTMPAPPRSWVASGSKRAVVSGIAVGPSNVVQRILIFTSAAGASYFFIPSNATTLFSGSTVINDNVTTSVIVDFSDAILLAATNADALFNLQELGECAGVIDYSSRLLWWGERNKVFNFNNPTFDGGFAGNVPLGWTADATFGAGGASAVAQGLPVVWGDAYAIVGDGATAKRGLISQSAYQDFNGVPIIAANKGFSVRARVAKNNALAQGTLHIHLSSVSLGIDAGLDVPAANVTTSYQEFTAVLTAGIVTPPSDLILKVYADGTPTLNGAFVVDNIEPFPTATPNLSSQVRGSKADDPESYDGVEGLLSVAENNGQAMRAAFRMRERLYLVKERSLHATDDNGQELASWKITEISEKVGTPSVRGVGIGEDWVVIASRNGLYIFWGTEPQKISQEIGHSVSGFTLAWDQINWAAGHTLWVTVDTNEKRVLIGAPFNGATSPNRILVMDYRKIDPDEGATGAEAIAANGPIRLRYTGMKAVMDKSRKWSPWTPSVNSCALIERTDGTAHLWMGAGAGVPAQDKGGIYDVQRGQLTDYSTAQMIPSYYWTTFIPQREQNLNTQMHEHRKYFSYLTLFIEGSGFVNLSAAPNQFGTFLQQSLPSIPLPAVGLFDLETPIDVEGERVAFKISQSGTASWFRLQKFTPAMMGAPFSPVRGSN